MLAKQRPKWGPQLGSSWLCLLACLTHLSQGQPHEPIHYETTYTCEGRQLELNCREGKLIHILRSNYGRFSLGICNESGNSSLSVQCYSFRAFLFVQTRCNNLRNCSFVVSKDHFGDPCEGTSKYLEVQYSCVPEGQQQQQQHSSGGQRLIGSHHRQPQPQLQPRQQHHQQAQPQPQSAQAPVSVAGEIMAPGQPQPGSLLNGGLRGAAGHKSPLAASPAPASSQGSPGQPVVGGQHQNQRTPFEPLDHEPEPAVNQNGVAVAQSQQQADQQPKGPQLEFMCAAQLGTRNLFWNYTRAGGVARQSCPEGSTGLVSWFCDPEKLRFAPSWSADFSQCRSNWLMRLWLRLEQLLASSNQEAPLDRGELREILRDLDLLARTSALYSEDLIRMELMLARIIGQVRSAGANQWRRLGGQPQQQMPVQLQLQRGLLLPSAEDLFASLASIVSSLFDLSQRQAWLELQGTSGELRRRLELSFLTHLKEAGLMWAEWPGGAQLERAPHRHANLFAGLTQQLTSPLNGLNLTGSDSTAHQLNLNRFIPIPDDQINELKMHASLLEELIAISGNTARFLVLDIRKPDYALIRHQLEQAGQQQQQQQSSQLDNGSLGEQTAASEPQWSSRIFGLFPILADGQQQAHLEQQAKLADLLAQWPISVDFRLSTGVQPQLQRQCNSFSETVNQQMSLRGHVNRCQTLKSSEINHVCRCDTFGFLSLSSVASGSVGAADASSWSDGPYELAADSLLASRGFDQFGIQHNSGSPRTNFQPPKSPLGLWTTVFIVLGLTLLFLFVLGLAVGAISRLSAQRRLNKKNGFLSMGSSILSNNLHRRQLSNGPTTGPLTDHNLIGARTNESITQPTGQILGLAAQTGATCNYKTSPAQQQQIYATHYPVVSYCNNQNMGPNMGLLKRWLSPANWFSSHKDAHLQGIQHRVINSATLTNPNAVPFKSQYQNGYITTGLHQTPALASGVAQHLLIAAPSSSNSSYVSSSAYYEEIGPINMAKMTANAQTAPRATHTVVDPFKQNQMDQQRLLATSYHHHMIGQPPLWSQHGAGGYL